MLKEGILCELLGVWELRREKLGYIYFQKCFGFLDVRL